jgi:NAD(P)-dependent dehydrogenase (short-subunit alcohol dehydrogenase family)
MEITSHFADDLFDGKTVFVTGGSSGINLGIALSFAEVGARVGICGRTQDKLDAAQADLEELGAEVLAAQADVRDYDALDNAFKRTSETLGPIHTLVCGAAGNFIAPSEELSANGFETVVDIDLNGSFNAARAAFDQLRATSGNLIFVSAGQAFTPYPAQAHCGAAKAGVDNLMRNLALEWGRYGIRSNSIAPGPVEGTEGVRRLLPSDEARDKLERSIPLGRFGRAGEIGHAAVFLASPLASYVTGTRLRADGGQNLSGSGVFAQALTADR